ncbi:hypothetical protein [Kitasatospora sp. MBT63]|uniref:hypothetical protein n=1 Tax=Kitasatospora sp. MBT63 TaxID=1444768 RepID=UPI000539E899|nr:hypothetical protein [Kitasatospora sp. MBT63]
MKNSPRAGRPGNTRSGFRWPFYLVIGAAIAFTLLTRQDGGSGGPDPLLDGLGAGLGALLGLQFTLALQLLLGGAGGVAPTALALGFGARVTTLRVGGMALTVRRIPVPFVSADSTVVAGPRLRVRLWLTTLVSVAVPITTAGLLIIGTSGFPRALGFGLLMLPAMSLTVLARIPLTAGWILFLMPLRPGALEALATSPDELAGGRAMRLGRLGEARAALDRAPADGPPRLASAQLRAQVALGEGRYQEAAAAAYQAATLAPHARMSGLAHHLRAAALVGAAETGELPPAEYLPRLAESLGLAHAAVPVLTRYLGTRADQALLEGHRDAALAHARTAAKLATDAFWQANAECSTAAALAALGRPDEARTALDRARQAMPELARIEIVAGRIGLMEVTPAGA